MNESIQPDQAFGIKEQIALNLNLTATVIALGLYAFPPEVRNLVRKKQKGVCADCGVDAKKLYVHHIVPSSMGGVDEMYNAVGLCNGEDNRCHDAWDKKALEEKIVWPGIQLAHVKRKFFKTLYDFKKSRKNVLNIRDES